MYASKGEFPVHASEFAALVEREMARGMRWLRFTPELERFYDDEVRASQIRKMMVTAFSGLGLFNLFLIADSLLIPDVLVLSLMVRLAVTTPIAALMLLFMRYSRWPQMRHLVSMLVMWLMTASTAFVLLSSQMPERGVYNQGVLLIIIYGCLIHRPQFWYAVGGCIGTNLIFSIGLTMQGLDSADTIVGIQLIVLVGSLFTLYAAYRMEREHRLYYLISLKERLHSAMMEGISKRDALTGLLNRRALDRRLEDLAEGAPGWQSSLAVIILDIDHFKIYNDRLGHQAGDDCLRQVAAIILSMMREGRDEAYRYGGEEFLLLISETDSDQAVAFAESIRRAIEARAIPHPESSTGACVTASFGVAHADATRSTPAEVIARADMALYAAKNNGRNRVWPQIMLRTPVRELLA